jgi:acyl-CoA synthetase (AMP-forming)/AMP-acid ligase II
MRTPLDVVRILSRLPIEAQGLAAVIRAGIIGPEPPWTIVELFRALQRYGAVGGAVAAAAIRHGDRRALVDERGTLSFNDLDQRSNGLANAWRARGMAEGAGIAILCRNHRGFLDATFAAGKLGARALYLNTDFSAPQAREVCSREGVDLLVHDAEFTELVEKVESNKMLAWTDGTATGPTLDDLIATGNPAAPPTPTTSGKIVVLTSGTTGTPKGAPRAAPRSLASAGAILSKIPYRGGENVFVAPPMFHAWGFLNGLMTIGVGSTLITHRRFDPDRILSALAEHRCAGLAVVPVMLRRLLAVDDVEKRATGLSLRYIAVSGSQLEAALATQAMDTFGDVVYNLYGSTEVAYATIATPADMRAAPGCAGRPPLGVSVKIFDEQGRSLPAGQVGRIFVNSGQHFEGYTGGGHKEVVDDHMSTGDVGHFDAAGRLFVDGRDDEMIVSGAENVFPREIEELLASHEAIAEAAAIGVPDEEFGQRLRAFVVTRPGQDLSAEDVKSFVKANLARYKVPRDVVFVDELPRNPAGKVLKRELAERKDE